MGMNEKSYNLKLNEFKITEYACVMTTRKFNGKILSTVSMSLEKRLTILPNGVVSNNSMGQRKT